MPPMTGTERPPAANDNGGQARRTKTSCPICRRAAREPYTPFCSARCQDVDLHRWISGAYVIPGSDQPSDEADDSGDLPPDP